jgi:hypothetical protein
MRQFQSCTSSRRQLLRAWGRYTMLAAVTGVGATLLFRQPDDDTTEPRCNLQAPCQGCRSVDRCQRPEAVQVRSDRFKGGGNG